MSCMSAFSHIRRVAEDGRPCGGLDGTEVTLDAGIDLADGQQLEIVATDFIEIDPAVTIANGSDFIARIGASNCGPPSGLVLSDESTAPEEAQKAALVDSPILADKERPVDSRALPFSGGALVADATELVVPTMCEGKAASIEVVNCLGQNVLSWRGECALGALRVPITGLLAGTYILRAQCSGANTSYRVVVP